MSASVTLNGEVTAVYENPLTGHRLLSIVADSGASVRVLLKDGGKVVMGERLAIEGEFTHHPPFGRYFLPRNVNTRPPEGLPALVDYLSRALNIDATQAGLIAGRFGDDVVDVLDRDFNRLREVGLPPDQIKELGKHWRAARISSDVERLCERLGLTPAEKTSLRERLGLPADQLAQRLREDPFLPYTMFPRVSFELADRLRRDLGMPALSPCRLKAALLKGLKRAARSGHTHLKAAQLLARTQKELDLADSHAAALSEALTQLSNDRGVAKRNDAVCLPALLQAEMDAVIALRGLLAHNCAFDPPGKQLSTALRRDGYVFPPGVEEATRFALATKVCALDHRGFESQAITAEAVVRSAQVLRVETLVAAPHTATAQVLGSRLGGVVPTVSQLLGMTPDGHRYFDNTRKLKAGLVVILGADAFDIELFTALLTALTPETSLVLIGDDALASPLGPGRPYQDLLSGGRVPMRRVDRDPDIKTPLGFMRAILAGEKTLPRVRAHGDPITVLPVKNPEDVPGRLMRLTRDVLPAYGGLDADTLRFLYPTYKVTPTPSAITTLLRDVMLPNAAPVEGLRDLFVGDPVYLSRALEAVPHPIGTRLRVEAAEPGPRVSVRLGGTKYALEGASLDALAPAYAVPSYLAAGACAPVVLLYLPAGLPPYLAHQQLLYSAAALATRHLFIVGDYDLVHGGTTHAPPKVNSGFGVLFDEFKDQSEKVHA